MKFNGSTQLNVKFIFHFIPPSFQFVHVYFWCGISAGSIADYYAHLTKYEIKDAYSPPCMVVDSVNLPILHKNWCCPWGHSEAPCGCFIWWVLHNFISWHSLYRMQLKSSCPQYRSGKRHHRWRTITLNSQWDYKVD